VTVGGEETGDITRLQTNPVTARAFAYAYTPEPEEYWDGYFYSSTVNTIAASCNVLGTITTV
jgi:hypothetical protein